MKNHLLAPIAFVLGAIVPLFSEAGPAKPAFSVPTDFQINSAMWSLFGNFDRKTKSSQFEIPQDTELDLKGSAFTIGDAIVVMPLWASIAVENRKHKVVLLTYAVPKSSYGHAEADPNNFECHACAPLIGVAIFVYKDHRWQIESLRTVVSRVGGFGSPPADIRIIQIGPKRIGIEISDIYTGGGETTRVRLILIPWKGKVNEAMRYVLSDDNHGGCGHDEDELPCYANRKRISFVTCANQEYFDILLTRSGTDLTDAEPYRAKSVRGFERLTLVGGFYKTTRRVGATTSAETGIESRGESQAR